jgi:hypothetical protein
MEEITRDDLRRMFSQYYVWKGKINQINEKLFWLEAKATKTTPSYSHDKGGEPLNNPRPSKVEAAVLEMEDLKSKRDELQRCVDICDKYFAKLRYSDRYLIQCVVCNKMDPAEFGRRWHMQGESVKRKLKRLLDGLC